MMGERLKTLRKAKRMTQNDLGERLGISASAIGMYEQNRREPDYDTLTKLSKLFDVTTDYFLLEQPASVQATPALPNAELNEMIKHFGQHLMMQDGLMFQGMPLSESDIQQVVDAIELGTMIAMQKLSQKTSYKEDEENRRDT